MADISIGQRIALTGGKDFWHTNEAEGVTSIMVADGPHGLRAQPPERADNLGIGGSMPATCFPPAVGLASTWDPDIIQEVGEALADEALAQGVSVILGPGINIKRDPRCGRNFEYFSEDPFLTGKLACALVDGIQSGGVGACVKHFAANNQETDRMRRDSQVDERTLREIYLRPFETVIKRAKPWTIMCSYNVLNGTLVSQNRWLLTEVLRGQWHYDGVVMSDWGAVRDRVAAMKAGLDLEMPANQAHLDDALAAWQAGQLDFDVIRRASDRVLALVDKANRSSKGADFDQATHHELARRAAGEAIVLLKNDDDLLPLKPDCDYCVIGEFARTPRYQGAGSSLVAATKVDNALDALAEFGAVPFASGGDEAVELASRHDIAVVFLGLGEAEESEGYDRKSLDIPADQLKLLDRILKVNEKVVVVVSNGAAVTLPFAGKVPAIVEGWLLGQGGGWAIAQVLMGNINPSGKLAETIPLRLEDAPSFPFFPGDASGVRYGEGLFVGYRGYDARRQPVAFPFGHGLSYTTFSLKDVGISCDDAGVHVQLRVTNTGDRRGRQVIQVYLSMPDSKVVRVPKELKGFASVALESGESELVNINIPREELGYWAQPAGRFVIESGSYEIHVGISSRDLVFSEKIQISGDEPRCKFSMLSTIREVLAAPGGREAFGPIVEAAFGGDGYNRGEDNMMADVPIGALAGLASLNRDQIARLVETLN